MSSLLRLKWNLSSSRFSNNTHPACSIPWYIHKNRIKTPDASGDKPSFADKPRSEWHATIYIMCYHHEATNVPPICTAVFILFIALWGKVSSDTWWWMSPMHVVNLVHVRSSETSTIINSKHESCSQGVYLGFFLIHTHTHIISPISPIRIHKNRIKNPWCIRRKTRLAPINPIRSIIIYNALPQWEATNVPPICTAVFILFIALWGKVSSDTWWWMSPMHVVNLVHVRSSETSTIINSKHESCPQGVYLGFCLIHTHTHIIR